MLQPDLNKDQLDKFKSAAHEAECDEDEAAFEDKLRRIAKAKPAVDDVPKDHGRTS